MYELRCPKLLGVFETLSDSVAAVLGTMKLELPTRAVVDLDEQG